MKIFFKLLCLWIIQSVLTISTQSIIVKKDCLSQGFNPSVLVCSTCETMRKLINDVTTYSRCKECCINRKTDEKYLKAVLEVDNRYLSYQPELEAIVALKSILNFSVKYRFGNPQLKMFKKLEDEEPSEIISVSSWNQDNFKGYLKSHYE